MPRLHSFLLVRCILTISLEYTTPRRAIAPVSAGADQLLRKSGLQPRRARQHLRTDLEPQCAVAHLAQRVLRLHPIATVARPCPARVIQRADGIGVYPLLEFPLPICMPVFAPQCLCDPVPPESSLASAAFVSALSPRQSEIDFLSFHAKWGTPTHPGRFGPLWCHQLAASVIAPSSRMWRTIFATLRRRGNFRVLPSSFASQLRRASSVQIFRCRLRRSVSAYALHFQSLFAQGEARG